MSKHRVYYPNKYEESMRATHIAGSQVSDCTRTIQIGRRTQNTEQRRNGREKRGAERIRLHDIVTFPDRVARR